LFSPPYWEFEKLLLNLRASLKKPQHSSPGLCNQECLFHLRKVVIPKEANLGRVIKRNAPAVSGLTHSIVSDVDVK